MRKAYSKQRRLDSVPIDQVELNLDCRDSIIPVLRALQHVYSDGTLTEKVLDLIGQDVNGNSRTDCGREGMDYWHLLVLASVRLDDRVSNTVERFESDSTCAFAMER